jgi:hypothetical protein
MILLRGAGAALFLLSALRYAAIFRRFRLFEHLMMTAGMLISAGAVVVLGGDVLGFLLGVALLASGVGLWIDGQLQILGNLRWREIRSVYSRMDLLLLRLDDEGGGVGNG